MPVPGAAAEETRSNRSYMAIQSDKKIFLYGLGISFPIILGYFPVAVAFGLGAKGAGFSVTGAVMMSVFVFAGASQFALLGLISGGGSIVLTSFICLALNARHIVYGPTLVSKLSGTRSSRLLPLVSFGLTDEVFSTALSEIGRVPAEKRMTWLAGLEAGAYFSWVFGTWLGAFSGNIIKASVPGVTSVLSFSLPALFLTLLVLMIQKERILPVIVAGITAALFSSVHLSSLGIIAAFFAGPAAWLLTKRFA